MVEPGPLLTRGAVADAERDALAAGAVAVVRTGLALFRLTGGGRVACLQGLVTCDVAGAGDDARRLGALLTVKGMIVSPLWITRLPDALTVETPADAAARVAAVFQRSLPPRLCRAEDVSAASASVGLYGPAAEAVLGAAGGAPDGTVVARVAERGVVGFECALPAAAGAALAARLVAAGAVAGSPALLEERRILAGVPRLGAEIDDHTLPQEVRLDDLGAVSFTKGCYLGQETVARIHFRGHANRRLAGLLLEREPPALPLDVRDAGHPVGRLTSACWRASDGRWVGLAVVKRAVADGTSVALSGGGAATVHALPWEAPARAAAGPPT